MSKSADKQLAGIKAGLEAKAAKLRGELAETQANIDKIERALAELKGEER